MGKGELGRFRNELKSKRDREKDKVGEGGMRGEKKRGEKNTLTLSLIFCRIIYSCRHYFLSTSFSLGVRLFVDRI